MVILTSAVSVVATDYPAYTTTVRLKNEQRVFILCRNPQYLTALGITTSRFDQILYLFYLLL